MIKYNPERREFFKKSAKVVGLSALTLSPIGCTVIGIENLRLRESMDFGEVQNIRFGVYKTKNVSQKRVEEIIKAINDEYAPYNLTASIVWTRSFEKKDFFHPGIARSIAKGAKIEPPCDRKLYLVGRTFLDNLWGALILPEISGWVDDDTGTHCYLVANYGLSLNQLIIGPFHSAKHEALHLLGCDHEISKDKCYERIKEIKEIKNKAEKLYPDEDFFPSYSFITKKYILTRKKVNKIFEGIRKYYLKKEKIKN